jgi:hypothetical protein
MTRVGSTENNRYGAAAKQQLNPSQGQIRCFHGGVGLK